MIKLTGLIDFKLILCESERSLNFILTLFDHFWAVHFNTYETVHFNISISPDRRLLLFKTVHFLSSRLSIFSLMTVHFCAAVHFWNRRLSSFLTVHFGLDSFFNSESQPEYFTLSNFVWYSNWPSRYHKLPSRCATATFTISSKTASQIDSHFHTMTWRDLHNSEERINQSTLIIRS